MRRSWLVCAALLGGVGITACTASSDVDGEPGKVIYDAGPSSDASGDGATAAPNDAGSTDSAPPPPTAEQRVLQLVNEVRKVGATCGAKQMPPVGELTWNDVLATAARLHSEDMCKRKFFDHTNPDGKSPFDRMTAAGYKYAAAGENIAAGQTSPEDVMSGWMKSPGHCENIMNALFTELGVGYAACAGGQYPSYWTQKFGKPR